MPKLSGFKELSAKLAGVAGKKVQPSVAVGVTAAYALYVHENLEAKHPVGQAKFLEQPARQMHHELADQVKEDAARMPLDKALFRAGLRLQRAMMPLIPVDTGALRASSFTVLEKTGAADLGEQLK